MNEAIEKVKQENDPIIPNHYHRTPGGMDVITYCGEHLDEKELLGFYRINIIKYVSRYDMKNGAEDLKKARFYLDKLIAMQLPVDIDPKDAEVSVDGYAQANFEPSELKGYYRLGIIDDVMRYSSEFIPTELFRARSKLERLIAIEEGMK